MKWLLLILLANSAHSQVLPVDKYEKEGSIQAIQKGLDDRFSVYGGTVAGNMYVSTNVYINGNQVILGNTNTFSSPVTFNSSVTVNGSIFGTLTRSTYTYIKTDLTTTGTSAGPSLAGSTVTLTTVDTAPLRIFFYGMIRNDTGGSQTYITPIVDGAYLSEIGTGTAYCHERTVGGVELARYACVIDVLTASNYSAGSHTLSISMWVSGNTGTLDCGEGVCMVRLEEAQ